MGRKERNAKEREKRRGSRGRGKSGFLGKIMLGEHTKKTNTTVIFFCHFTDLKICIKYACCAPTYTRADKSYPFYPKDWCN
jgi:hypothetical protein